MSTAVPAIEFLSAVEKNPPRHVNVLFGDEPFLKRRAFTAMQEAILSGADAEFSLSRLSGAEAQWRDVTDDLSTVSLFGDGRRIVAIDDADDFVREHRTQLEDYTAKPIDHGALILIVGTWPKNTRLFKAIGKDGLQVDCNKPTEAKLKRWLTREAKSRDNVHLTADAAEQMIDIIGPEIGMLDQELAKLSSAVDANGEITPKLVHEMVGGWRAKTAWDLLDAACDGNAEAALLQLERLILAGEHPVAILGQVGSSLRRHAAAARIYVDSRAAGRRMTLRGALEQVGVRHYYLDKSERQLKRIGRERALLLYRWLLDADLAVKGPSSAPHRARLELEKLILRIAMPASELARPARAAIN